MDLATDYLGLRLRSPLVASASPLSGTLDGIRSLADAGAGAVVLPSLFEEQVVAAVERHDQLAEAGTESFPESLSFFPAREQNPGRRYLSLLERARAAVSIPVIGSLNGATPGGWTGYARAMQDAGAAAIELNVFHLVDDPPLTAREVEQRHVEILERVKDAVQVPVAVKISPYFSSITEMAERLDQAGADGLVLFNRFLHADIDPETLQLVPGIGLSSPADARLPRTWIAQLRGRVHASLAASTGVEDAADVARYLLAGADVVMTTSALLRNGADYLEVMTDGLVDWMARKHFDDLRAVRGRLAVAVDGTSGGRERARYVDALGAANSDLHGPW
ncbi:MAG TPA: dihydroorotate dehydrogenase-like protein [Mycobacteriales bacterium]|nr:dihydroorotate dehydrogenase-like protein [Mycobacteriales bacterium]